MRQTAEHLWERTALVVGTGLGVGRIPVAPGTFGSLWGLPLVWGLLQLHPLVYAGAAAAIALAAVPICGRAARSLQKPDPGSVVFDEIAAFPIVFSPLLFLAIPLDFTTAAAGFMWFRLFDVVKPWPVRTVEKLPGGVGIVADDLAAGVYAAAMLWLTVRLTG